MRRFGVLLSLSFVLLFGTVALHTQPVAIAQEATPAVEGFAPEGIPFEPVAFATGVALPATGKLSVSRVSFEPRAGFSMTIAAGQEVTLQAGDTLLFPPDTGGEIGNNGQERAVVLVVFVGPPEDMTGEATPAP